VSFVQAMHLDEDRKDYATFVQLADTKPGLLKDRILHTLFQSINKVSADAAQHPPHISRGAS